MLETDVVKLYHQAKSVMPGEPDELGADMWAETLRDLRYADAYRAMITLLKDQTFVSPAEIRTMVKKQRNEIIAKHGEPIPPAGLTFEEEIEWKREAYRVIGDGGTVPQQRGELRSGPPLQLLGRNVNATLAKRTPEQDRAAALVDRIEAEPSWSEGQAARQFADGTNVADA